MLARAIPRRTGTDVAVMRRAGRVVAEMHEAIRAALRPGVTTLDLDRVGRDVLERRRAASSFLGYQGYPAVICASPNEVVVHGIPDDRVLVDGDIVSIDCGAVVDGWHGDAAFTAGIGEIDAESGRLIDVAERSLVAAIETMVPGGTLGDIGAAVSDVVEGRGLAVVEGYTGHGIGRAMHEAPSVPNVGRPGRGLKLRPGNVLAVEPMVSAGTPETDIAADGWTVSTLDGARAAHVEHTIVVTEDGPEILTAP